MTPEERDRQIRVAAMRWLDQVCPLYGDSGLPWKLLVQGFELDGTRISLAAMNGIFKPAAMPYMPLTIRTSVDGPYDDFLPDHGPFRYRFRGENPEEPDNRRLRATIAAKVPLIYLFGVVEGRYFAEYPVFVVGEDKQALTFFVERGSGDELSEFLAGTAAHHDPGRTQLERRYATASATVRLHQRAFRERVLEAYAVHCAMCHLKHESLLDAAHIIPDSQDGLAEVRNGLALCKIHHAAYDRHFMTIRPDYSIEVRQSILNESDGPMLQHGIKNMHGKTIRVPTRGADKPDREFLEVRYKKFRELQV